MAILDSNFAEKPSAVPPVRYVHRATGITMVRLSAGNVYATREDEQITTVLGSCVAACIRNRRFGIGGMNHFMLPGHLPVDTAEQKFPHGARYGVPAMEALLALVRSSKGSDADLEVKIFGGASVMELSNDVGGANVEFVFDYLAKRHIPVVAQDVGVDYPRKIVYDPHTGSVQMQRLRSAYRGYVVEQERRILESLPAPKSRSNT